MKRVAPLRYDVIFKKAFCDRDIFTAFVQDVLGIKIEIDHVETEKRFAPPIGRVDSRFDPSAGSGQAQGRLRAGSGQAQGRLSLPRMTRIVSSLISSMSAISTTMTPFCIITVQPWSNKL